MLSSPFQHPSPRQNVLASHIQDVQRCGDARQLALLLGQWVHRFGIDSLPVTHGSCSEAITESLDQLQSDAVLGIAAPSEELVQTNESDVSLDLVAQELVPLTVESLDPPAVLEMNQLSEELSEELTEAELTTFPENLIVQELLMSEEESTTPVEPVEERNVVVPMTPPPISTPRSLRRWLPRADQSFPQAS